MIPTSAAIIHPVKEWLSDSDLFSCYSPSCIRAFSSSAGISIHKEMCWNTSRSSCVSCRLLDAKVVASRNGWVAGSLHQCLMFMRVKSFPFFLLGHSLPKWMVLFLIYGGFSSFAVTCNLWLWLCYLQEYWWSPCLSTFNVYFWSGYFAWNVTLCIIWLWFWFLILFQFEVLDWFALAHIWNSCFSRPK